MLNASDGACANWCIEPCGENEVVCSGQMDDGCPMAPWCMPAMGKYFKQNVCCLKPVL